MTMAYVSVMINGVVEHCIGEFDSLWQAVEQLQEAMECDGITAEDASAQMVREWMRDNNTSINGLHVIMFVALLCERFGKAQVKLHLSQGYPAGVVSVCHKHVVWTGGGLVNAKPKNVELLHHLYHSIAEIGYRTLDMVKKDDPKALRKIIQIMAKQNNIPLRVPKHTATLDRRGKHTQWIN